MRYKVAILFGGEGVEREVSFAGADSLSRHIDRELFDPMFIEIAKDGGWYTDGEAVFPVLLDGVGGLLKSGTPEPIDAVFPLLHGEMGEDGNIQGALATAHIPFVGCPTLSGALAADKIAAKAAARSLGIRVLPDAALFEREPHRPNTERALEIAEREIGYPMFIKPSGLGSSVGAAAVFERKGFREVYETASALGSGRVLIEEYLENRRELECAWLEYNGGIFVSPPAEIKCEASFYSYEEKYSKDSTVTLIPRADVPDEISYAARDCTLRIAELLGCRDLCRADFFLAGDTLIFNEINTMPGMTKGSLWMRLAEGSGLSRTEIVTSLLLRAIERR